MKIKKNISNFLMKKILLRLSRPKQKNRECLHQNNLPKIGMVPKKIQKTPKALLSSNRIVFPKRSQSLAPFFRATKILYLFRDMFSGRNLRGDWQKKTPKKARSLAFCAQLLQLFHGKTPPLNRPPKTPLPSVLSQATKGDRKTSQTGVIKITLPELLKTAWSRIQQPHVNQINENYSRITD